MMPRPSERGKSFWLRLIRSRILRPDPFGRCVSNSCSLNPNPEPLFAMPRCRRRSKEMRIRPVRADELDLFLGAAGSPDHHREVQRYLDRMFAAGSMRPEWCFVALGEGDRPLGRVAFWTLPGMEAPFALVLLDVPWDGDYIDVGRRLLEVVLEEARSLGRGR